MLSKRQLATVAYALIYLASNYDEAILWDEEPQKVSHLFKEYSPLSEYEVIKLAESLEAQDFAPKLYQLEASDNKAEILSKKVWTFPEDALEHQDEFIDEVCSSSIDPLDRQTIKVRVVELEIDLEVG